MHPTLSLIPLFLALIAQARVLPQKRCDEHNGENHQVQAEEIPESYTVYAEAQNDNGQVDTSNNYYQVDESRTYYQVDYPNHNQADNSNDNNQVEHSYIPYPDNSYNPSPDNSYNPYPDTSYNPYPDNSYNPNPDNTYNPYPDSSNDHPDDNSNGYYGVIDPNSSPSAGEMDPVAFLDIHNQERATHEAPPLRWSDSLAKTAQSWGDRCEWKHSHFGHGENLAGHTGSMMVEEAMKMWMDEESYYDPSNPVHSHFTQAVWKGTQEIGCSISRCDNMFDFGQPNGTYYVCEYSPQGNIYPMFDANVKKTRY